MSRGSSSDMSALARPYARALAAEVAEWKRPGSALQRAEVLRFVDQNGASQVGRVAAETGISVEAIRAAVPERVKVVRNDRAQWREVVL